MVKSKRKSPGDKEASRPRTSGGNASDPENARDWTHMHHEIERKFSVLDFDSVQNFVSKGELAGFRLDAPRTVVNVDTYVDTRSFTWLRHGLSVRLRAVDETLLVTLKSLSLARHESLLDRIELEAPAPAPYAGEHTEWMPEAIRDYLSAQGLLHKRTQPLISLHQKRIKRVGVLSAAASEESPVFEMSVDAVTLIPQVLIPQAANIPTPSEATDSVPLNRRAFYEVEFEALGEQNADALAAVAADPSIAKLDALSEGKLQRALKLWAMLGAAGLTDKVQASGPFAGDAEMRVALAAIWRQTLVELILLEAGVRADQDIEFVHQMRVALRQARSAGRFLAPWTGRASLRDHLRGMRDLARSLGNVRDLDVILADLAQSLDAKSGAKAKDLQARYDELSGRRNQAFAALLETLDGKQHRRFIRHLFDFCAGIPVAEASTTPHAIEDMFDVEGAPKPGIMQVRHVFPALLLQQYRQVRAYETAMERWEELPENVYHALRIECKRLRYMLEFCAHLLGTQIRRILTRLRKLQELLGALNDAYVELAMTPDDRANLRRRKQLAARIVALRARVPKRLQAFVSPKSRRQFMLALSEL